MTNCDHCKFHVEQETGVTGVRSHHCYRYPNPVPAFPSHWCGEFAVKTEKPVKVTQKKTRKVTT